VRQRPARQPRDVERYATRRHLVELAAVAPLEQRHDGVHPIDEGVEAQGVLRAGLGARAGQGVERDRALRAAEAAQVHTGIGMAA
jgi:hypothetical protein